MRVKCLLPIIFKTLKHSLECGFLHLLHACQTPATLLFVQFRDLGLEETQFGKHLQRSSIFKSEPSLSL